MTEHKGLPLGGHPWAKYNKLAIAALKQLYVEAPVVENRSGAAVESSSSDDSSSSIAPADTRPERIRAYSDQYFTTSACMWTVMAAAIWLSENYPLAAADAEQGWELDLVGTTLREFTTEIEYGSVKRTRQREFRVWSGYTNRTESYDEEYWSWEKIPKRKYHSSRAAADIAQDLRFSEIDKIKVDLFSARSKLLKKAREAGNKGYIPTFADMNQQRTQPEGEVMDIPQRGLAPDPELAPEAVDSKAPKKSKRAIAQQLSSTDKANLDKNRIGYDSKLLQSVKSYSFAQATPIVQKIGEKVGIFSQAWPTVDRLPLVAKLFVGPFAAIVDGLVLEQTRLVRSNRERRNQRLSKGELFLSELASIFGTIIYIIPMAVLTLAVATLSLVFTSLFDLLRFGANYHAKSLENDDVALVNRSKFKLGNAVIASLLFAGILALVPYLLLTLNVLPLVNIMPTAFGPVAALPMQAQLGIYTGALALLTFGMLFAINRIRARIDRPHLPTLEELPEAGDAAASSHETEICLQPRAGYRASSGLDLPDHTVGINLSDTSSQAYVSTHKPGKH